MPSSHARGPRIFSAAPGAEAPGREVAVAGKGEAKHAAAGSVGREGHASLSSNGADVEQQEFSND